MRNIIGIDECGIGSLAGPLYVAAVVLPEGKVIKGVKDSKKFSSEIKRNRLIHVIDKESLFWVITVSNPATIDEFNVEQCNRACMSLCAKVAREKFPDAKIIVDGNEIIEGIPIKNQRAVPKADEKYQAVSAASIMAKVHRDKYMVELGLKYPEYSFQRHKGYPTQVHKEALVEHGICPEHRKSYGPIKQVLQQV